MVWNIFYFSIWIGNVIIPIDFHISQRGRSTTNQASLILESVIDVRLYYLQHDSVILPYNIMIVLYYLQHQLLIGPILLMTRCLLSAERCFWRFCAAGHGSSHPCWISRGWELQQGVWRAAPCIKPCINVGDCGDIVASSIWTYTYIYIYIFIYVYIKKKGTCIWKYDDTRHIIIHV